MPHIIDQQDIENKLFILKQLVLSSKEYCKRFKINRYSDFDEAWDNYYGHLKINVSNYLIEIAIKTRMLQDFAKSDDSELDIKKIDQQSINKLNIGEFMSHCAELSLRESCNKIVHAVGLQSDGNKLA